MSYIAVSAIAAFIIAGVICFFPREILDNVSGKYDRPMNGWRINKKTGKIEEWRNFVTVARWRESTYDKLMVAAEKDRLHGEKMDESARRALELIHSSEQKVNKNG